MGCDLSKLENAISEWEKVIENSEKVNLDKEYKVKDECEDRENDSFVTLNEGTDLSQGLKGTIQSVKEERKEKRKGERQQGDDEDKMKRIRRENKDNEESHRDIYSTTNSGKMVDETRGSDSNHKNNKDWNNSSSYKSSSNNTNRSDSNSSSKHNIKLEIKYKEKVGDIMLNKEKIDDSPVTNIFDLLNDTDNSEKTNCVDIQSDNSNNSTSSLITNTEEEGRRNKVTKEETEARISPCLRWDCQL